MKKNNKEILSFIKNAFIFFVISTFLFISISEFFLFKLGETGNFNKLLLNQKKNNLLYGPKISQQSEYDYKLSGVILTQPKILILGTSTMMQVSNNFVIKNNFYNSSINASVGRGLLGMKGILEKIPKKNLPEILVLGLDPWIFNPNYPPNKSKNTQKGQLKKRLSEYPIFF